MYTQVSLCVGSSVSKGSSRVGWELILYWSVWFRLNALNGRPARGLLATKYPFWLGAYVDQPPLDIDIDIYFPYSKYLNLEAFDKKKVVGHDLQRFLETSCQTINAGYGVQEVDECETFIQFSDAVKEEKDLLTLWICLTSFLRWDQFGFPNVRSYHAAAAASTFPITTPVSLANQLLFIQISAEDDDSKDGIVQYRTIGDPVSKPVPPLQLPLPIAPAGASNSNANSVGNATTWLTADIDITKSLHAGRGDGGGGGGGGGGGAAAAASTTIHGG
jgi:hypothetical protein